MAVIREAAILFLLIVAVGLLVIMWRQHPPAQVAISPLTPASCPKLSNPCDKIDCNRPNTKAIA